MHLKWKNCPTSWTGQYKGKEDSPTIVLEAVADERTWIWHCFFGEYKIYLFLTLSIYTSPRSLTPTLSLPVPGLRHTDALLIYSFSGSPGSNNDININDRSPLWVKIANGTFPKYSYQMSHGEEDNIYYAADNIYPEFPVFMQSCGDSVDPKIHFYSKRLEAVRKDVERAFGILQARFAFLKVPCLLWHIDDISNAVHCCMILHNMIIEDEENDDNDITTEFYLPPITQHSRPSATIFEEFLENTKLFQSHHKFKMFRMHLINHLFILKNSLLIN